MKRYDNYHEVDVEKWAAIIIAATIIIIACLQ